MNATSFAAILEFDLKNCLKDKVAVGMLLIFPIALYVFFATFFGVTKTPEATAEFYETYTVNFAAVILLNIAFLNLGPTIVLAKESGLFRRLFATPLEPTTLWLATVTRTLIVFVIGYVGMLLTGFVLLGHLPQSSFFNLAIPAILSAFCILSIGFLLGAMFERGQTAFNAGMILVQPMLLLSGAGFSRDAFPDWAYALSNLLPFTYAVDVMQLGWNGEFFTTASIIPSAILIAVGLVCAAISNQMFRKELR